MNKMNFTGIVTLNNGEEKTFDNVKDYNKYVTELVDKGVLFSTYTESSTIEDKEVSLNKLNQSELEYDINTILDNLGNALHDSDYQQKHISTFESYCNKLGEDFEKTIETNKLGNDVDLNAVSKLLANPIHSSKKHIESTEEEIKVCEKQLHKLEVYLRYAEIYNKFLTSLSNYLKLSISTPTMVKDEGENIAATHEHKTPDMQLKNNNGIDRLLNAIKNDKENEEFENELKDFFNKLGLTF